MAWSLKDSSKIFFSPDSWMGSGLNGFRIAEIGCRCRLVSQICIPPWFPFWLPLPSCLLNLSSLMFSLLLAVAILFLQLVSLYDFPFDCHCHLISQGYFLSCLRSWLPQYLISSLCLPSRFRFWLPFPSYLSNLFPFIISLLAAELSPKLVFLHDFALGCRCRLLSQICFPLWFRFWLPLSPCLQICFPSWFRMFSL